MPTTIPAAADGAVDKTESFLLENLLSTLGEEMKIKTEIISGSKKLRLCNIIVNAGARTRTENISKV